MWPIIIVIAVVVLLVLWAVSVYNKLISMRNNCEEAFSTMDVYLKKRYDLIPNLVETVKGYAKHESETLEKVISARNAAYNATTPEDRINADNALTGTLKTLFAVAESYPELKANTNFTELMNQLKAIENDIANSRKYYNGVIKSYNTVIEKVPSNIVASLFKFTRKPLFDAGEESRENVKVQF